MYLEEMKMKQLTKLMEEMKQGVYRDTLKDIYIDEIIQIISTEWCLQPLLIWMRSQL